jgi:hypothetical protein
LTSYPKSPKAQIKKLTLNNTNMSQKQEAKVKFYVLRPTLDNPRATTKLSFKVANFGKAVECLKKEKAKGETITAAYFEGNIRERNIRIDRILYE